MVLASAWLSGNPKQLLPELPPIDRPEDTPGKCTLSHEL
jgi:hypothetical protein